MVKWTDWKNKGSGILVPPREVPKWSTLNKEENTLIMMVFVFFFFYIYGQHIEYKKSSKLFYLIRNEMGSEILI